MDAALQPGSDQRTQKRAHAAEREHQADHARRGAEILGPNDQCEVDRAPDEFVTVTSRTVTRRKVWFQSHDTPSLISASKRVERGSRSSWKDRRMNRSETKESAYDTASKRNGTARPTANSTPPSGWPARSAPCSRAWFCAIAAGSCSRATTCGRAEDSDSRKKTNKDPSTKATTTICANGVEPRASVTAMLPSATARPASVTSITRFLFHRSTSAPAGR